MRRYMWPNSALPCATTLMNAATKASRNRFTIQAVENHGGHYPRTLREWGRRLEANVTMDTMTKRHPGLADHAAFEAFKRKWRYLFAYAGAGFAKGYISCHMLTFYKVYPSRHFWIPEILNSFFFSLYRTAPLRRAIDSKALLGSGFLFF